MNYSRMTYLADGAQTSFGFAFKVDHESELRVFTVDPLDLEHLPLYLTADYTVTGVGDPTGGSVELTLAGLGKAVEGVKLVIKKGPAYECSGGGQPVPGGVDYSFEEQWTGKYDLTDADGPKKIYVKTLNCGVWPDSTSPRRLEIPIGISDLKRVLNYSCIGLGLFDGNFSALDLLMSHPENSSNTGWSAFIGSDGKIHLSQKGTSNMMMNRPLHGTISPLTN